MKKRFLNDVIAIRRRVREHAGRGAVTEGYRADRELLFKRLNEALAMELICMLRYKRHRRLQCFRACV